MTGTGKTGSLGKIAGKESKGMTSRKTCRICASSDVHKFLSLGPTPLANSFLKESELEEPEPQFPLDVYFCKNCFLVQLMDVVSPELMFKDYAYLTGASKPMQIHFSEAAKDTVGRLSPKEGGLIVDIGSNDGTLLKCFSNLGFRVLGIEPAANVAKLAEKNGVPTVNAFFSENCAIDVRKKYGGAEVIFATNVFAHVDNLEDFVKGASRLLSDNGTLIIEAPYLLNLLKNTEFDTVYHEHLSYFSIQPLVHLFRRFGMEVVDIKQTSIHGGSIRVFVKKSGNRQSAELVRLIEIEKECGIDSLDTYTEFAKKVALLKEQLVRLLKELKGRGMKITGYGATAKGNTLLNYCGIGTDVLSYISDTTPLKQGKYSPGMHIPVISDEAFRKEPGNYALLLAWNYAESIIEKEKEYRKNGGKFILPLPEPKII